MCSENMFRESVKPTIAVFDRGLETERSITSTHKPATPTPVLWHWVEQEIWEEAIKLNNDASRNHQPDRSNYRGS